MTTIYTYLHGMLPIKNVLLFAFIAVLSWLSIWITKKFIVRSLHFWIKKTKTDIDDVLVQHGVLDTLVYLAPALVIYYGSHFFPNISPMIQRLVSAYCFFILILVIDRVLSAALSIYERYPISRKRPIKGYIQIIKIFFYVMGTVLIVCVLIDQSPWAILSGIGALTAVLLLVFRDTILSLVASIQIVTNDLIHVGDWIEMPQYGADGEVIELALHTVKIQNWDKTITTIPTYKLIQDSFKNWRGMGESGGRRIKRSILIDQLSIRFLEDEEIERLKNIKILRPYLEQKERELREYNSAHGISETDSPVNGRRLTNIGTFRAYCVAYLKEHHLIRKDMTFLVRQLPPSPQGLPLEIYVFAADIRWANYEAIQADIFDHLLAAISEFGLRVFQYPSGHDLFITRTITQ